MRIAVLIPAHNEETQIAGVIESLPDFVDHIVIIDDNSSDNTVEIVEQYRQKDSRIALIRHGENKGVGGAMATGYKYAADNDFDVAVRMDGGGFGKRGHRKFTQTGLYPSAGKFFNAQSPGPEKAHS